MALEPLLVAAAASSVVGVAFCVLGAVLSRRPVSPSSRLGQRAHAAWWLCLGGYLLLQGALTATAWRGALTQDLYLRSRILAIPLLCIAVWGLSSYLVFLRTGSRAAVGWLALGYAAVAAVFAYATIVERPGLVLDRWVVGLDDSSPVFRLVYALVGLPPLLASVLYLLLARKSSDAIQRRRAALTSLSILAYVGGGLAARMVADDLVVFLTLVPLGLMAAAAALAAQLLRPPPLPPLRVTNPELAQRIRDLL